MSPLFLIFALQPKFPSRKSPEYSAFVKPDPFTLKRLQKYLRAFRDREGKLATAGDLDAAGFDATVVTSAVKEKLIEELYSTLTSGAVVKGFKCRED